MRTRLSLTLLAFALCGALATLASGAAPAPAAAADLDSLSAPAIELQAASWAVEREAPQSSPESCTTTCNTVSIDCGCGGRARVTEVCRTLCCYGGGSCLDSGWVTSTSCLPLTC